MWMWTAAVAVRARECSKAFVIGALGHFQA